MWLFINSPEVRIWRANHYIICYRIIGRVGCYSAIEQNVTLKFMFRTPCVENMETACRCICIYTLVFILSLDAWYNIKMPWACWVGTFDILNQRSTNCMCYRSKFNQEYLVPKKVVVKMLAKQIAILKPQWIEILTGTNIKQCFLFIHPVWPATPPGLSCHLKHEQYWHCQSIFPWKYHTGEMHIPCTWRQKYCLPATHHLHKL